MSDTALFQVNGGISGADVRRGGGGMMTETIEASEYAALVKKPPKYGNRKTEVDGHLFDSAAEARRYGELKLLLDAGKIERLTLQPRYTLYGSDGEKVCTYVADFTYLEDGAWKVEDVKGVKTAVYRIKKKLMKADYGIDVIEIAP
jgi:hypothetical protein